jgi:hypothetical protein
MKELEGEYKTICPDSVWTRKINNMYLEKPQIDFITEIKQKIRHIMLLKISNHWLEKLVRANKK